MKSFYLEGIAKLRFGAKPALFAQDPDSAQIAYSKSSMSICAETGPGQKSSNLASKASFAIPSLYFGLLFVLCTMASADVYPNVNFPDCLGIHSERLMMSGNSIYVVSTFDQIDYFTAYTFSGDAIWEISFNSEIISSKMKDDLLFIFSRARNGMTYYLTCLDTLEGKVVWEKAILAPNFMSFSQ